LRNSYHSGSRPAKSGAKNGLRPYGRLPAGKRRKGGDPDKSGFRQAQQAPPLRNKNQRFLVFKNQKTKWYLLRIKIKKTVPERGGFFQAQD